MKEPEREGKKYILGGSGPLFEKLGRGGVRLA